MPRPRLDPHGRNGTPLGAGRSRAMPTPPRKHRRGVPAKLPVAHLEAHDRGRLACGRPFPGAVLADRATRQPPEGHRLCGLCERRLP